MKYFKTRRKKAPLIFAILGIVLMLSSVTAMFWWETKGRSLFLYKEVLVLNQSVETGTTITEDMVSFIRVDPFNFIEGALVSKEKVLGKITYHYIPKYSQLNLEYFLSESVEAREEDQYIFTVPADWIITFPNSLRRGDTVYFYPVKVFKENVERDKDNSFNTSNNIKISSEEDLIKSEIAYLKDSGNREVVDTEGEERYDASANISSIEIITSYEDFSYLKGLASENYKFIILYKKSL